MSEESKNRPAESEKEFEKLGARKVGHHSPVKGEKEIDLTSVGGVRVRRSPLWETQRTEPLAKKHRD